MGKTVDELWTLVKAAMEAYAGQSPEESQSAEARLRSALEEVVSDSVERLSCGGVLVRLHRDEGYEDVHPQLVAEDAIKETWPSYETLTQPAMQQAPEQEGR